MAGLNVLVTGGAGFIGSFIADELLARGHRVRVFDCLAPQVHGARGEARQLPDYLSKDVEFIYGDVRDRDALDRAMTGMDVIYHEAAAVGVGQSMYQITDYTATNTLGTAVLLDLVVNKHRGHLKKLIVASSMSIYGEGRYADPMTGAYVLPQPRTAEQLGRGEWEMRIAGSDRVARPVPCDEAKPLEPTSIYAINKRDQEEMVLAIGAAYGLPAVALRYFNVYGPRQALSNPYTGVAAIFSSCYLAGNAPMIFEDGEQSRDFVHVRDIARANLLALESDAANGHAINIGTGRATSILRVADMLLAELHPARKTDPALQPKIVGKFRAGDIRHCYADITRARTLLGYEPTVHYKDGIRELIEWVKTQQAEDKSSAAFAELQQHKLV